MSTCAGRPRRKCVSVSFVGDDDVIEHIIDANQKRKGGGNNFECKSLIVINVFYDVIRIFSDSNFNSICKCLSLAECR